METKNITFEEFNRGDYKDKPSREEFRKYQDLQFSGITNMFDIQFVQEITGLSREKIFYIMKHYSELENQYYED